MRLLVNMAENGLLPDVYGLADAGRWLQRRRMFFMTWAELWGYGDSRGRIVSHYLLKIKVNYASAFRSGNTGADSIRVYN